MAQREWAGTTYGNAWMHRTLIKVLRHTDVRLMYAFAAIFVVPVCLLLNDSRRVIYRYMRQRHGMGRMKAAWKTYANHCMMSQLVIDRFAMYSGKRFDVKIEGYEHYRRLELGKEGFVQLSSHVGNYEIAGYTLVARDKAFNAVVFGGEKESVMAERINILSRDNIRLILLEPDMSHIFAINNALAQGEVVSMPADRIAGSNRYVEVTLLGASARLPLGPFQVTTARGLEALAVNVIKTASKRYTVYVAPLNYDHSTSREEKVKQLAQAYTAELERILRIYPTQWYNFYDFWN